jgi:uncharacterized membrane protein
MSYLFDLIVRILPDAWILAAIGAAGLWIYQLVSPVGTRWILSAGAVALAVVAGVLYGQATGREICEERARAAVEAERVRQEAVNERALAESRLVADQARAELLEMKAKLEEAVLAAESSDKSDCVLPRDRVRDLRNLTTRPTRAGRPAN